MQYIKLERTIRQEIDALTVECVKKMACEFGLDLDEYHCDKDIREAVIAKEISLYFH